MKEQIGGQPKTLRLLLKGVKYSVHYYQREYQWGKKQIEELIEDLTEEFLEYYDETHERRQVDSYGHYFMGSIVLTSPDNAIIDGQQRLTSLTLLLMFLNQLQAGKSEVVDIKEMIYSEKFGKKSFNIDVPERTSFLEALFNGTNDFDFDNQSESVRNLYARYKDIEEIFPEELKENALPFFIDWLIEKVDFIEISAKTEQDAHKVFVSMNDRGLSLTSTEMLKGFLLSEISDDSKRSDANDFWKSRILELKDLGKEEDSNFFKNFLRAQYAITIREKKKDSEKGDYDIIGDPFHKWVRENTDKMKLSNSPDYINFVYISKNEISIFDKFSKLYIKLNNLSKKFDSNFPYVFFNANRYFTFQSQLILASIDPSDTVETIDKKINIVSCYLDQYISIRVFNFKTVDYSSIKDAIFTLTKEIRRKPLEELAKYLKDKIDNMEFKLDGIDGFYLNGFTKRYMLHILSRLTWFLEIKSGRTVRFEDYVSRDITNPYDIEHIWADHFDRHLDEFSNEKDFQDYRNRFGALLILPRDKNRSFQDSDYGDKINMYYGENYLAASLNSLKYQNDPQFLRFINDTSLSFTSKSEFKKNDIIDRQNLYKELSKQIWDSNLIIKFLD